MPAARLRAAVATAGAALALALLPALPATAADPVDLGGAYVLDDADALGDRAGAVDAAIDDLYDETGLQLFVVYVEEFGGVADPADWANETAYRNGLGRTDLLLAVATVDRNYSVSIADDSGLTESQLAEVEDTAIIPSLRENDWAGAAIAAADGYAAVSAGDPVPAPDITPAQPAESSAVPFGTVLLSVLAGIAVVVVAIVVVVLLLRRRERRRAERATADEFARLDREASALLVQLDDDLATSAQELGFAEAEFGELAAPFRTALDEARGQVREAFAIRQRLDDAQPETDDERRAGLARIIELCRAADERLDDQSEEFDRLRDLERTAATRIPQARTELDAVRDRVVLGRNTLVAGASRWSDDALEPVAGNPDQAERLLAAAARSLNEAEAAVAENRAAAPLAAAQAAIGQAGGLLDAIDARTAELQRAADALPAARDELRADLADAARHPGDAGVSTASAAASALVTGGAVGDPVAALARLTQANADLDRALAPARDAEQRRDRARAALTGAITTARSQLSAADDYIRSRRGGVGAAARTRLSEADRLLSKAESGVAADPQTALDDAQRAGALATAALNMARSDVSSFSSQPAYTDDRDGGGDLGDMLLSGLAGYVLGGGGSNRSSGWGGGSSWGGGGSSWGGSSRSSRPSSGGFGGGFGGGRSGGFGGSRRSSGMSSRGGRSGRGGRF